MYTGLAYLSDVCEGCGGETEFPLLGLKVLPKKGALLLWRNLDYEQQPDMRTLHAGLPLRGPSDGEKLAANFWVCAERFETYRTSTL